MNLCQFAPLGRYFENMTPQPYIYTHSLFLLFSLYIYLLLFKKRKKASRSGALKNKINNLERDENRDALFASGAFIIKSISYAGRSDMSKRCAPMLTLLRPGWPRHTMRYGRAQTTDEG